MFEVVFQHFWDSPKKLCSLYHPDQGKHILNDLNNPGSNPLSVFFSRICLHFQEDLHHPFYKKSSKIINTVKQSNSFFKVFYDDVIKMTNL